MPSRDEECLIEKNYSIFAADDYFFHPSHINAHSKMKSSRHSSNFTVGTATTTLTSVSEASESHLFSNLERVTHHIKLCYGRELPLRCTIDKHGRVLAKDTNKMLQN
jgi:tartrate dehydratase beta subunit/fumarate hydratase class I family protein